MFGHLTEPRLFVFCLALGGLRDPRLFALAGAAAWTAVWVKRPALGPARPWLPWLGWAALSTAVSAQPLAGLPLLAKWSAVLACASLADSWSARERADWLKALLVVAAALAVAALSTGAPLGWRAAMTGLLPPNYNYTAFVLAAAAAAAAAWGLHPRGPKGRERAAAAAVCALAVACILLARSRGALLGLVSAAALWAVRRWGRRAAAVVAVAAALFAGALAGGILPESVETFVFKKYRKHAEARPRIWNAAVEIAAENPWLGTGPGNFAVGFRRRPVAFEDGSARWAMGTSYAHSEPLQAAAETGWAGLALWLLGGGCALGALFRRAGDDPVREAAAAAAAAMTAQLASDNMLQIPALAALWLCALSLTRDRSAAARWPRPAVLAGAALALLSWVPRTLADAAPSRAAALFPAEPGPREDLAYEALAGGRAAEAEVHWAAAQALEPFNGIHPWRRAQLAGASGDWDNCERLAERAIDLEPAFLRARLLRAEALVRLGRKAEARAEINEVSARRAARGEPEWHSGYEQTVWELDARELARAQALLSASASGRK